MLKFVTSFFIGERFEWDVKLTPDQVIELIRGKNEGTYFERIFAPGLGVRIKGPRFFVSKMSIGNIPVSGNSFTHLLVGQVEPTATGTKVTARFRLPLFSFVFAIIWLTLATVIGFGGGLLGLRQAIQTDDYQRIGAVIFALLFPLIGILFLASFRRLASSNEKEIKQVIEGAFKPYLRP